MKNQFQHGLQIARTKIKLIRPDTPASEEPILYEGLVLETVNRVPVAHASYQDCIEMIRRSGRPIRMSFVEGVVLVSTIDLVRF